MPGPTIHFRGVCLFVANDKHNYVTQVLFPRADEAPPEGTDDGPVDDPTQRQMTHADKSKANPHFAGALCVRPDKSTAEPFLITGGYVRLDGYEHKPDGARFTNNVTSLVPPLDSIVTKQDKKLRLTKRRSDPSLVAGRFDLDIGDFSAQYSSGQTWEFTDDFGTKHQGEYRLDGSWTLPDGVYKLNIRDLENPSNDIHDPITLGDEFSDVYFFNFDNPAPDLDDLIMRVDAYPGFVDHDFKWVYKIMKPPTGNSWVKWLDGKNFPAPRLPGLQLSGVVPSPAPAVSVSTCFEVVWAGANE